MSQYSELPEPLIIQHCRDGDNAAWRELHRRYVPVATAFLRKLGVVEDEFPDAVQEVFVQVYRYLPRFRAEASLQTWLYRLCITQARSVRRRSGVRSGLHALLLLSPEYHPKAAPSFSERRALTRLHGALDQIPPRQRKAFVLYEMDAQPGKVIAEVLRCTEASVWRLLHDSRRALRDAL
jgi:RNA polymerase sigma-70 factor (ECF subfamily)